METWIIITIIIVCLGLALNWLAAWARRFTQTWLVREHQTGLYIKDGKCHGSLGAGKHRFWGSGHEVVIFDTRKTEMTVQGQELITADKGTVKLTAVATYRIADAWKMTQASDNATQALYTQVQLALRKIVGSLELDAILEKKAEFGSELLSAVQAKAEILGYELESVDVRDLMLGGDLKKIYANVIGARQEALATQEKARGEAAALRTLANASRLFDNNPNLLQLRYLDAIEKAGETVGNTLVLGMPEDWSMPQQVNRNGKP